MSEMRNVLIIQAEARGTKGVVREINQVAASLEDVADNMPPDDFWPDASELERMASSMEEAADYAHDFSEAVEDVGDEVKRVNKSMDASTKNVKELTAEERKTLALTKAREKVEHDMAILQDEESRGARKALALEQKKVALGLELKAQASAEMQGDRKLLASMRSREQIASQHARSAGQQQTCQQRAAQ